MLRIAEIHLNNESGAAKLRPTRYLKYQNITFLKPQ